MKFVIQKDACAFTAALLKLLSQCRQRGRKKNNLLLLENEIKRMNEIN